MIDSTQPWIQKKTFAIDTGEKITCFLDLSLMRAVGFNLQTSKIISFFDWEFVFGIENTSNRPCILHSVIAVLSGETPDSAYSIEEVTLFADITSEEKFNDYTTDKIRPHSITPISVGPKQQALFAVTTIMQLFYRSPGGTIERRSFISELIEKPDSYRSMYPYATLLLETNLGSTYIEAKVPLFYGDKVNIGPKLR